MIERTAIRDDVVRAQLIDSCRNAKPLMGWIGHMLAQGGGELHAWVPIGVSSESMDMISNGLVAGGTPQIWKQSVDPLVTALRELLNRCSEAILLSEDQMALPTDPWLRKSPAVAREYVCLGDVVYHIVRHRDLALDDEQLRGVAHLGRNGWLHAVVFCRDDDLLKFLGAQGGTLGNFRAADIGIESIWFEAYDGDGYIVWSV